MVCKGGVSSQDGMGCQSELVLASLRSTAGVVILLAAALSSHLVLLLCRQALPALRPLLQDLVKGSLANRAGGGVPDVLGYLQSGNRASAWADAYAGVGAYVGAVGGAVGVTVGRHVCAGAAQRMSTVVHAICVKGGAKGSQCCVKSAASNKCSLQSHRHFAGRYGSQYDVTKLGSAI